MKSAAVLTVDEAFAFLIFFASISAAKGMAALKCPGAREFAIQECSCHAPGFTGLGGGGVCREVWAHQRLTDALLICSSVTDTSACGWKTSFIIQVTLEYKQIPITDNEDH